MMQPCCHFRVTNRQWQTIRKGTRVEWCRWQTAMTYGFFGLQSRRHIQVFQVSDGTITQSEMWNPYIFVDLKLTLVGTKWRMIHETPLQRTSTVLKLRARLLPLFHVTKASHQSLPSSCCKVEGKKINAAIFSFCLLQSVIEMENQMNGKQIIVLSIFPGCPTRVSAEWSWVGDMTRTKCEIEQLGGNKSALTTKSDQHVAAASGSLLGICSKAVYNKWGIFISLLMH